MMKQVIKDVVGQIVNMLYTNSVTDENSESFECWCEDGDVFENCTEEHIAVMERLSVAADELSYAIEQEYDSAENDRHKEPMFISVGKRWDRLSSILNAESEKFIKSVLEEQDGKRIEWESEECEKLCEYQGGISVTYDGGNHPEYASDAYSRVYAVYLDENGKICLEIEDSEEYELERVQSVGEVYDVARFLLILTAHRGEK